jgi:gas vesicle protein
MNERNESHELLYLFAGIGIGTLIGAAVGVLMAPKAGEETREELASKLKELKGKTEEWVNEQKAKKNKIADALEEVGV